MRFLGRKVYVGAAVVIASVVARSAASVGAARRATGICTRTVRRWSRWWRDGYGTSEHFAEARSRMAQPVEVSGLPGSLWQRFAGRARDVLEALERLLGFIAPVTTGSVADGSRFVGVE